MGQVRLSCARLCQFKMGKGRLGKVKLGCVR